MPCTRPKARGSDADRSKLSTCFASMSRRSILSILCFELTTVSTIWGICFSLEANPNLYNPALFGTFLAWRGDRDSGRVIERMGLVAGIDKGSAHRMRRISLIQPLWPWYG